MIQVSIIVPVYNAEQYIERCIDSLCNQDMSTELYEVIAIDDGSSDKSLELLIQLEKKYLNLKVFSQNNRGASAARNLGLQNANGRYIGFVDADDWVESHMYKILYDAAERNDADIVFCNLYTNDKKNMRYLPSGTFKDEAIKTIIYPRLICSCDTSEGGKTIRGAVWCKLFKRQLVEEHNIRFNENLIYNEDGLFCIEATLKSNVYEYMGDDFLYHHILDSTSITKRYIDNLWYRQKGFIPLVENSVKDEEFDFTPQIRKKFLEIAIYSIENEIKKSNPYSMLEKIKHVRNIMCDTTLRLYLKSIKKITLTKMQCAYLFLIKYKLSLIALSLAKYRYRNNKYM